MKQYTVCLRTRDLDNPSSYSTYRSIGGYSSWERVISGTLDAKSIIEEVKKSQLRGRGGAGFPTGLKWTFMPKTISKPIYAICNADESEPGAFKDREILKYNPHQLIEGMALGAYAIGAQVAYCYIRGEFAQEGFKIFSRALKEAYENHLLGKKIIGNLYSLDIYPVLGAGAYVCGEETALMESLEGKKGWPRYKPPFPANYGLFGSPTNINNVETYTTVPFIIEKGGDYFSSLGVGKSGGVKIFSISGHVHCPGNYEVPLGTPFQTLLQMAGGVWRGKALKAIIPGGSSTPIIPAHIADNLNMDYESIQAAGSFLGSGSVIVLDEDTDLVALLERISLFYYRESCGQCSPCREGTGWAWRLLSKINNGQGTHNDLDKLKNVAQSLSGKTICALADAAAMPILSYLKHFSAEFEKKIQGAL